MMNFSVSKTIKTKTLSVGGTLPIRLQSMTNTATTDIEATVSQIIRIAEAGADWVRVSVANHLEAKALAAIKKNLENKNFHIPLIADVHFKPKVAEFSAQFIEKVRINPGNYIIHKKSISQKSFLEFTSKKLEPLIQVCKKNNTVLRVGINHGSLSESILYQYGNTPRGMVASAVNFITVCQKLDFHDLVISIKSSDVIMMIKANLLMVDLMKKNHWNYPLHLGVTEAGNELEGRIKSAAGIGYLLANNIGDTIRVSLTEEPEKEISFAQKLVRFYGRGNKPQPKVSVTYYRLQSKRQSTVPLIITKQKNKLSDLNAEDHRLIVVSKQKNPSNKIIKLSYPGINTEDLIIRASVDFTKLVYGHRPAGIWLENKQKTSDTTLVKISSQILQTLGLRFFKTEFIACPSCSRTHFNIQKELKKIKAELSGFKGKKIAVMGCIVNGPGEMEGADFGIVGSIPGKVNLYKGKTIVSKNIPQEQAVETLKQLIMQTEK